jgi:hypothetical protein
MGIEPKQNPILFGDISDVELGDHGAMGQGLQNSYVTEHRTKLKIMRPRGPKL